MQGKCLCGSVQFEISATRLKAYQCHCSLCRKQSGTASNLSTLVPIEQFRFLSETTTITSWIDTSGFRSDFCACCGSPVPNPFKGYYWIPIGLLEGQPSVEVIAHLCVASKANWDTNIREGQIYEHMPDVTAFLKDLTEST